MSDTPETWRAPFSYDIDSDGVAHDVGMLGNPSHSQGAWVKLDDYRDIERQRDEWMAVSIAKQKRLGDIREQRDAYAETLRDLLNFAYERERDYIRERHPELAQEASQT